MDVLHLYVKEDYSIVLEAAWWSVAVIVLPILVVNVIAWKRSRRKRIRVVSLDITLGGVGTVKLAPQEKDIEVAHKIWTELVTRKAAVPIDLENDVILEVYDSWYELFARVRDLISQFPAHLVQDEESSQRLVHIAIESLNQGLRPHLTEWQARYRHWNSLQQLSSPELAPQEIQRLFPEYQQLTQDLLRVNGELMSYADELRRLVQGR